jgi:hypothetical protein
MTSVTETRLSITVLLKSFRVLLYSRTVLSRKMWSMDKETKRCSGCIGRVLGSNGGRYNSDWATIIIFVVYLLTAPRII